MQNVNVSKVPLPRGQILVAALQELVDAHINKGRALLFISEDIKSDLKALLGTTIVVSIYPVLQGADTLHLLPMLKGQWLLNSVDAKGCLIRVNIFVL